MNQSDIRAALAAGGRFVRRPEPVVRAEPGSWCSGFLAPTSLVRQGDEHWLYAEGSPTGGREAIGVYRGRPDLDPAVWTPVGENPVVEGSERGFDRGGVFDPAVIRLGDTFYLYYSATEDDAHHYAEQLAAGAVLDGPSGEWIGLATSTDGVHWRKHPEPVLDARCPFAVVTPHGVALFYVRVVGGGYQIFVNESRDPTRFSADDERLALPVGPAGSWDAATVTTPKVLAVDGGYLLGYAGGTGTLDDPTGFGLAFSADLGEFQRSLDAPFLTAPGVGFDAVCLQSPLLLPVAGATHLLYSGSDTLIAEGLHSQIGLATLEGPKVG